MRPDGSEKVSSSELAVLKLLIRSIVSLSNDEAVAPPPLSVGLCSVISPFS